tara:strand:+ start:1117 stop:1377 length:261 start_codon:yes stop_codon:yes gene_type:complete
LKIVDITEKVKSKGQEPVSDRTSQALLDSLSDFCEYSMHNNIKAFAVVAIDSEGQVSNSWHSDGVPVVSVLGAVELMKIDFMDEYL